MFVCLGNICRSPMAEFMFADKIKRAGLSRNFGIASAGTSGEEEGNPVHRGALSKLKTEGVSVYPHYATKLTAYDYDNYDFFIGMDGGNVSRMTRIFSGDPEHKVYKLLDFTGYPRDIADPWYTGNFDATYLDINEGLNGLIKYLNNNNLL